MILWQKVPHFAIWHARPYQVVITLGTIPYLVTPSIVLSRPGPSEEAHALRVSLVRTWLPA